MLRVDFDGDRIASYRLLPYRLDAATFAPRPVRGPEARAILDDVRSSSSVPVRSRGDR